MLLVVEDDQEMRSLLCDELRDLGCQLIEAGSGEEAVQRARETAPNLIVTDLRMPSGGLGYIGRLRTAAPECPIILMTAFGDPSVKETAERFGVAAYFDKPVRMEELKNSIKQLLSHRGSTADK